MKRLVRLCAVVLAMTVITAISAVAALADTVTPAVDITGAWESDNQTVTFTGKVNNPNNTFYSGAVALDYDPTVFTPVNSTTPVSATSDKFQVIHQDVDTTNGHISTEFAAIPSLEASDTPTDAFSFQLKLKDGKTKDDVESDDVTISDDTTYISGLNSSYSGGPVTLYASKNKDDDAITKYGSNDATASGSVTVPTVNKVSVTSVAVTPTTNTVPVGDSVQLTAKVSPDNATNQTVTWTSSDPTVATVSDTGLVKGIKKGSCTITATTADGSKTASASVSVTDPAIKSIDPCSCTTTVGSAPVLPTTVKATYTDGTSKTVAVTWDAVPQDSYAKEGTFTVNGTVAGTSVKAACNVKVEKVSTGTTTTTTTNNVTTGENVRMLIIMGIALAVSVCVVIGIAAARKKKVGQYKER